MSRRDEERVSNDILNKRTDTQYGRHYDSQGRIYSEAGDRIYSPSGDIYQKVGNSLYRNGSYCGDGR